MRKLLYLALASCQIALAGCKDDAKDKEIAALRAQLAKGQPSLGAAKVDPAVAPVAPVAPAAAEDTGGDQVSPFVQRLAKAQTLAEAIQATVPLMEDTINKPSEGTGLLALWSSKHLQWADVGVAKNETTTKLILKDSDAARGKRMCVAGDIIQIAKERGTDRVYSGLLGGYYGQGIISYIAIGDTGELVENSAARFCGVVTGRFTYGNAGGGTTHAVSMVGMFDLPGNNPQKKKPRRATDDD